MQASMVLNNPALAAGTQWNLLGGGTGCILKQKTYTYRYPPLKKTKKQKTIPVREAKKKIDKGINGFRK
jgi:hypothetical protein